jgi:uncharacterized membrane protein
MSMKQRYRSWIPGIVFWVLFLVSLALGKRYSWLDTVWNLVWLSVLFVIAIVVTFETVRKSDRDRRDYVGHMGVPVPRWVVRLFGGDDSN